MITVPNIGYVPPFQSHSDASYIGRKTVTDLYKQMKEQNTLPTRSISSAGNLTSLCVDISPSSSNFFEVLYIGKIKVWHRKVPDTFIDDALERFKQHELDKKKLSSIGKLKSDANLLRRGSTDSTTSNSSLESVNTHQLIRSQSSFINTIVKTPDIAPFGAGVGSNEDDNISKIEDGKITFDIDDHNRTMVLQVDRTDLRLISPDRKVILLHKHHKDVSTCVQGLERTEHFGFICRENNQNNQAYIGYIFKCESASVASDAVSAITQAFLNTTTTAIKPTITSCDHCPMVWYHKLCTEIEHLSDRKTQAAILRRLDELEYEEQQVILTKFRGAETDSIREQNEFLMMLLRAHCEMKQGRHMHDTAENRSEFLNQYLGGGTIFMKAKRSLTNSFEMLKRKASKDDFGSTLKELNLPINQRETSPHSPNIDEQNSEGIRRSSSTIDSQSDLKDNLKTISNEKNLKSPMMDIFLKVGSSPKADTSTSKIDTTSTWRQAIFKRVITPKKDNKPEENKHKLTRKELRDLWKKSIYQAILLVRMEKENACLKAKQEESAVKRIKLEYDEMKPTQREVMDVWDMLTSKEPQKKIDHQLLLHAIRQGVPRGKRGEVWQYLAEEYCSNMPPIDLTKYPNYNMPYEQLLKQLTSHQHAILIDLGRTFPNHSYFSSPLGPGQLALFNLLKAYSLLDSEMGYCQGMSFVAGVLLLHMEESQAFFLLRHLMFRRGLRKQYLPDMNGLQIKLYQLSRLLHDKLPDLYQHFDLYEIAPTLYAAPWLLTIFASQFPLGFVTRVFDLMFLENPDVIFRVAIALLTYHRHNLLLCESFEEIMNYLKNTLPNIDKPILDNIMKQVYTTDISRQLHEYLVEYQVLQEEMTAVQPQVEELHKMEHENKQLKEQNKSLTSQLELALSNVQRLEKTRTLQQSQLNRLEMHSRGLDVTVSTLGNFINNLVEQKLDIADVPDDVRRILGQISEINRRRSDQKSHNLMKMFENPINKQMTKSLSTGKITHVPTTLDNENMPRSNSLKTDCTPQAPKVSQFFSTSHSNILQNQKKQQIDITVQDFEKVSPSDSIDSGCGGTPASSPNKNHPLNCDDVNFTYNGTRELKNLTVSKHTRHSIVPNK